MILIITPYGRTETAEAALRLADHVVSLGLPVKVVASPGGRCAVHPAWDHKVLAAGKKYFRLYNHANKCQAAVHFRHDRKAFNAVRAASKHVKQILVFDWHAPFPGADLAFYHKVVCPSQTAHFMAKRTDIPDSMLVPCRWDAGVSPVQRGGLVEAHKVSALWWCGRAVMRDHGAGTAEAVCAALKAHAHLHVTLAAADSGAWPPVAGPLWEEAIGTRRLDIVSAPNLAARTALFHAHDWVVFPDPRATFGLAAAAALACGAAVLAPDVPPWSEYVVEGKGGRLVPCQAFAGDGKLKAPIAVVSQADWADAAATAFALPRGIHLARSEPPPFAAQKKAFARCWAALLDG